MLEWLIVPPTGDARMPIFHVKEGRHQTFAESFDQRFGDCMTLVETSRADAMRLFGGGPMTESARRRFGDFIAFPFTPSALAYAAPGPAFGAPFLGLHGGLSPDEMLIPLVIA
jgi:hypothetical protein